MAIDEFVWGFSNSSNTTTPPPVKPDADITDGHCADNNLYFICEAGGCGVLLVVCLVTAYLKQYRPSTMVPTTSTTTPSSVTAELSHWKPYFGRPYIIGLLLFSIAFWNLLPGVLLFLSFHILAPSMFEMVSDMACTQIVGFPFVPIMLFYQGVLLLILYNATALESSLNPHINNNTTGFSPSSPPVSVSNESVAKRRVLMVGSPSRGLLFARAMKDECDGLLQGVDTYIFDISDAHDFLIHNSVATCGGGRITPEDVISRIIPSTGISIAERLTIPRPGNSFDKIVICPFLRGMTPIGDYITPPKTKSERMKFLLSECIRVLRPGGQIVYVDGVMETLLMSADIRDATGDAGVITDPSVSVGVFPLIKMKYVQLQWTKTMASSSDNDGDHGYGSLSTSGDRREQQHGGIEGTRNSTMSCISDADEGLLNAISDSHAIQVEEAKSSRSRLLGGGNGPSGGVSTEAPLSYSTRAKIIIPYQIVVFILLLILSGALFSPLNVPNHIVLSQRLNGLPPSVATNYPLMAYFTRSVLYDMDTIRTPKQLMMYILPVDVFALLLSLLFSLLFWLPQFLLQLALNSTSLTNDAKSYIGIGISVFIGYAMFRVSQWRGREKTIKDRHFTEEQVRLLKGK